MRACHCRRRGRRPGRASGGGMALAASSKRPVNFQPTSSAPPSSPHGPWPAHQRPTPATAYRAYAAAIALGRRLFFDTRLSIEGRQLVRHLPRPGEIVRRRPDAQPWPRAARPQRHRARQPAPQSLVRLGRRRRQSVGAKPAPDPGRQGIRHDRATTARPPRRRADIGGSLPTSSSRAAVADRRPERMLVNLAKALAAFQETIVTRARPSTTSAMRSSETTRPAWPAIRSPRSAA